jgi:hypothetical protein
MAGMVSVRVTREERKKLLALKVERGCANMSETIRLALGFPRTAGPEGFDGADDIEGVASLCKTVIAMIDRVEMTNEVVYTLAKQAGLKEIRHRPIVDLVRSHDGPHEFRGGHQHPALPAGFVR